MPPTNTSKLLNELNEYLLAFKQVFSSIQWGGKAYKLPDIKGNKSKPKLFVFTQIDEKNNALIADFKLPLEVAANAVEKHAHLTPSPFSNWAKTGWVSARFTTTRQLTSTKPLFKISYDNLPKPSISPSSKPTPQSASPSSTSPVAQKIDTIMQSFTLPSQDDAFDD